jgi:hypothetical protein
VPRQATFAPPGCAAGLPFGSLALMPTPPGGAAPAGNTVRILEVADAGRRWKHRLAEFNAEVSFEDVKAVLTSAIANVA